MLMLLTAGAGLLLASPAMTGPIQAVDAQACRVVDVAFTPAEDLQIVVWLEDAAGQYVDTLFITEMVGHRGLGNRPGRMDFNSAWRWPYGRRINTFPIWAHRHGETWPMVIFQNDNDQHSAESALSHSPDESSIEAYYCRPLQDTELDTTSCASTVFTDKGRLSDTEDSLYPPRADFTYDDGTDDPSATMMLEMNPFDAVTQATPVGGARHQLTWSMPSDLPAGDYAVWIETAQESDFNATYNETTYPEPTGFPYSDYGVPYRGQPSVVYRVPVHVAALGAVTTSATYGGYGDPDGLDGDVRPPDDTIDGDVPGSGAQRLLTTVDADGSWRAKVVYEIEMDEVAPDAPDEGQVLAVTSSSARLSFREPGDDGAIGTVAGYEIRYRAGTELTEANFLESSSAPVSLAPDESGVRRETTIEGLLPQTHYYVGIRAYDNCKNYGPLEIIELTTAERQTGEVDACFVATAAYGSLMANDVVMLRDARDRLLRSNVAGELLVEAYYTFGPALAGIVGESEDLRGIARDALDPLVAWMREVTAWRGEAGRRGGPTRD